MMEMIGMVEMLDVVGFWSLDLRLESVNNTDGFCSRVRLWKMFNKNILKGYSLRVVFLKHVFGDETGTVNIDCFSTLQG